jgi:hypothetical protein
MEYQSQKYEIFMKIGYEHSNKFHMKYCFYFLHTLVNDAVRNSYDIELKVSFLSQQLQSYVRFEAFTAVTMKNVVFWDVALCRT